MPLFETVTDLDRQQDTIRTRRYGVIEVVAGELKQIRFRPFPAIATVLDPWLGRLWHRGRAGDRCLLYFNQPLGHSQFLSVTYAVSWRDTTYATIRKAAEVLDRVAQIKRSDALLCDAANPRISQRLLRRWGWEPHAPQRWHRNFIKRLYPQGAEG